MKENTLLSYDMYEELKSELIKTLKAELSKMPGGDNWALMQRLEQMIKASALSSEQITALANHIGQIDFKPVVKTMPPDNSGIKSLFEFIHDNLKRADAQNKQTAQEVKSLREEVVQMKTEVDTTEFEKLSHKTICEMQTQIRYLKQPPIVLKVIIGLAFISLLATWAAGYYIRDRRVWKQRAEYWYEQTLTLQPPEKQKKK